MRQKHEDLYPRTDSCSEDYSLCEHKSCVFSPALPLSGFHTLSQLFLLMICWDMGFEEPAWHRGKNCLKLKKQKVETTEIKRN